MRIHPVYSSRQGLRAFGLMQSVGAMAIGLVVVTGSLMMMNMTRDSNLSIRTKADFDELMSQVAHVIETKAACEAVFGGIVIPHSGVYHDPNVNNGDANFEINNSATFDRKVIAIDSLPGIVAENTEYGSDPAMPSFRVTAINLWSDAMLESNRKKQFADGTSDYTRFHYLALQIKAVPTGAKQNALGLGGAELESSTMRFIVQVEKLGNKPITSCHCRSWSDCPITNGAKKGFYQ